MANITINEISQNYTYNIGTSSFCTVALPITACWGPAFEDPSSTGMDLEAALEATSWQKFPATQAGLEAFVATYRGPAAHHRIAKDYSYQMAMTLLTAGYDILVCRLCPGTHAEATITDSASGGTFTLKAKYPGTFGNSLMCLLKKVPNRKYWNLITYVVDASGVRSAVENIIFAFDLENAQDNILHIDEVESKFFTFVIDGKLNESSDFGKDIETNGIQLGLTAESKPHTGVTSAVNGTDRAADSEPSKMLEDAVELAELRYACVAESGSDYVAALESLQTDKLDASTAAILKYKEWLYTYAVGTNAQFGGVYDILKDKLAYNFNRIISPGWDDQDICEIEGSTPSVRLNSISPIHIKLMDVAYYSRCATGMLDIPKSLPRKDVYNESEQANEQGYAQMLARYTPSSADVNGSLYHTHSALFAPWGQYKYVGTSKQNPASPSFIALMIQRAMVLNQSTQYEWIMPSNRKHNLSLGKLDYNVPKKLLDIWQKLEGVGVNVITNVPDLGTSLWGNSTLYEVPPATYQALANLSTRYLVNAVEDVAYRVGISITFQYNNDEAYSRFYAGVTPILDTMKNAGAIDGYLVKMAADINGLDQVNANTVIGKIYLTINGVINDIIVDLIALPPGTDLGQFNG